MSEPFDKLSGVRLGQYEVETPIGSGGMGSVYRARDTNLNRPVAIKFLSSEMGRESVRRFQQEARTASSLNHPHIVMVHEAGDLEGRPYMVTEFVDGGTLRDWAATTKPTWQQSVELLVGAADALACAHEAGILHRDIKPENILVTRSGYAKLADFGLAKSVLRDQDSLTGTLTTNLTQPGLIIGTLAYMSPEQASGKPLDARSDIFSFGVVLYELLAGRRPFAGETDLEVLQKIVHGSHEPLSAAIPDPLRSVVEKALEKNPAERYPSMREMVEDLRKLTRQGSAAGPVRPAFSSLQWTMGMAVLLIVAALVWKLWPSTANGPVAPQIRSIAVLPLLNLSRDPEQDFFSDGTTEALISNLARIHSIGVVSRTSIMRYKGTTKTVADIGRELGVDALLQGSVQRAGGRVRISAQLIRAATDRHIWAKEYERDAADVLKLEDEMAQAIAKEIQAQVTPDEAKRLAAAQSVRPEVHEEFLLGQYNFWRGDPDSLKKSIDHYQQAIDLQRDYAPAYAGLALSQFSTGPAGQEAARKAAQRAVDIDPSLAEGHTALAGIRFAVDWDWAGADTEFRTAMQLNPDSLIGCGCYSLFLIAMGRFPEANALISHAAALDPVSAGIQTVYGVTLFEDHRFEESIPHLKRAIELDPKDYNAYLELAFAYEKLHRFQEALEILQRTEFASAPPWLGRLYALMGRREDALRLLESYRRKGAKPSELYLLYFALGDKDRGFDGLSQWFDERGPIVPQTKFNPLFDDVQSDPRFKALVARLKLPE
jgi:TolB-like protein/Tfp pilus assembly protein PilF